MKKGPDTPKNFYKSPHGMFAVGELPDFCEAECPLLVGHKIEIYYYKPPKLRSNFAEKKFWEVRNFFQKGSEERIDYETRRKAL